MDKTITTAQLVFSKDSTTVECSGTIKATEKGLTGQCLKYEPLGDTWIEFVLDTIDEDILQMFEDSYEYNEAFKVTAFFDGHSIHQDEASIVFWTQTLDGTVKGTYSAQKLYGSYEYDNDNEATKMKFKKLGE
jgi:hypothetical protein